MGKYKVVKTCEDGRRLYHIEDANGNDISGNKASVFGLEIWYIANGYDANDLESIPNEY